MIKLDISTALFFYLFFNVIGILLLWVFFNLKTRNLFVQKDEDCIHRCLICTKVYINSRNDDISKCPQCGSLNSKEKRRTAL
ncbi:MAG: hypothetical protein HQ579_08545 [Candidatus Omnitrophica bacterium]|nr:hypothetical protein [Candidatus Omnitrophota bacterium]